MHEHDGVQRAWCNSEPFSRSQVVLLPRIVVLLPCMRGNPQTIEHEHSALVTSSPHVRTASPVRSPPAPTVLRFSPCNSPCEPVRALACVHAHVRLLLYAGTPHSPPFACRVRRLRRHDSHRHDWYQLGLIGMTLHRHEPASRCVASCCVASCCTAHAACRSVVCAMSARGYICPRPGVRLLVCLPARTSAHCRTHDSPAVVQYLYLYERFRAI